jgi:hypothetical protein
MYDSGTGGATATWRPLKWLLKATASARQMHVSHKVSTCLFLIVRPHPTAAK